MCLALVHIDNAHALLQSYSFMHYSSYAVLHTVRAGASAAQAKTTFTHVNLLIEQKALKSSLGMKSEDCTKNSR